MKYFSHIFTTTIHGFCLDRFKKKKKRSSLLFINSSGIRIYPWLPPITLSSEAFPYCHCSIIAANLLPLHLACSLTSTGSLCQTVRVWGPMPNFGARSETSARHGKCHFSADSSYLFCKKAAWSQEFIYKWCIKKVYSGNY